MTNLIRYFDKICDYLPKLNPVSQSVVIASLSHLPDLNAEEQFEWLRNIAQGFNFLEDDAFEGAEPLTDEQKTVLRGLKATIKKNAKLLKPGKITPIPL